MAVGDQAYVRLTLKQDVAFGEDLCIVGSSANLGCWDVSGAAVMQWSEGGIWVLETPMPCGVMVELKVVVRAQNGILKWFGVREKGEDGAFRGEEKNITLECRINRMGARGSRFVQKDVPFDLKAEDIATPENPVGGQKRSSQEDIAGMLRQMSRRSQSGSPRGNSNHEMVVYAKEQPEDIGAKIAEEVRAAAGRAVTYTTTTVTTVCVGADGQQVPPPQPQQFPAAGMPQSYTPPGYTQADMSKGGGHHGGGHHHGYGHGGRPEIQQPAAMGQPSHNGGGMKGGQGSPTGGNMKPNIDEEALKRSRESNSHIPRMGPVALHWPGEAAEVLCQGSWDDWAAPLTMEPAPGGGFRLLMVLPPGEYELKFIVDGEWCTNDSMEYTACDNKNNVVCASNAALAPLIGIGMKALGCGERQSAQAIQDEKVEH